MPLQDITPLPTAPARSDAPDVFNDRADAFVAALPGLVTEINTLGDELELTAALINAAPAYADAGLVALTGLTPAADKVPYWTSSTTSATMTVTSAARSLLDDTTAGAMLTTLGLSSFGQSLVDDADEAAARTTLGLGTAATTASTAYDAAGTASSAVSSHASATSSIHGITTFMATVLDDTTAAAARTTLSALGFASVTFGTNTIALSITLSNGDTLLIQGGTGSLGGNTTGSVTFGTSYSTAPVCVLSGGNSDTNQEGDVHVSGAASTTGISICNSATGTGTYTWLAIGKA